MDDIDDTGSAYGQHEPGCGYRKTVSLPSVRHVLKIEKRDDAEEHRSSGMSRWERVRVYRQKPSGDALHRKQHFHKPYRDTHSGSAEHKRGPFAHALFHHKDESEKDDKPDKRFGRSDFGKKKG